MRIKHHRFDPESLKKVETELDEMGTEATDMSESSAESTAAAEATTTSEVQSGATSTSTATATTSADPVTDNAGNSGAPGSAPGDGTDAGTIHRMEDMFGKLGGLDQKYSFLDGQLTKLLSEKLTMDREITQMTQDFKNIKEASRRDTTYLRQSSERDASDLRAQEQKDMMMVDQKLADLKLAVDKPMQENNEKMADFSKDMNTMRKRMEASIDDMKKDVKFQVDGAVIKMKRDNENLAANYQQTAKWINQDIGEFEEMYRHIVTEKDQLEKKLMKTMDQMREGLMNDMHQKIEALRKKNQELSDQYHKDMADIKGGMGNINKQYQFFAQLLPFVKLHAHEWLSNHEGEALSRFLDANAKDNKDANAQTATGPQLNEKTEPTGAPAASASQLTPETPASQ